MPRQLTLLGYEASIQDVPPMPATGNKPGKLLMLKDPNTGDCVMWACDKAIAASMAEELTKSPVDIASAEELQQILENGRF